MSSETEREAFEAQYDGTLDFGRDEYDQYVYIETRWAWAGWLTRADRAAIAHAGQAREGETKAIEFAEYLAKDAERFLEAWQESVAADLAIEDGSDVDDDQDITAMNERVDQAKQAVDEHARALRSGIYEFRKRAGKFAALKGNSQGGE